MPITDRQIKLRREHLGSSDMAAVLGLDRFRNPYDVWLDKTGKLVEKERGNNQSLYAGNAFEDGVLQFAETSLGKLRRNQYRSAKDRGLPIGANVDALVKDTGLPVEAKTAGLYGPLMENWGEEGTDQVPDRVIIQAQVHLICTLTDLCHIAAFLQGRGFMMFQVPADKVVQDYICETALNFWNNNVIKDIPPQNVTPSLEIVKRVRREPKSIADVDHAMIDVWKAAKDVLNAAKKTKNEAEAALLAAMGNAEAGASAAGNVTYYEQTRKGYVVQDSAYRVLRFTQKPLTTTGELHG